MFVGSGSRHWPCGYMGSHSPPQAYQCPTWVPPLSGSELSNGLMGSEALVEARWPARVITVCQEVAECTGTLVQCQGLID